VAIEALEIEAGEGESSDVFHVPIAEIAPEIL
jgi:hypothetical protein